MLNLPGQFLKVMLMTTFEAISLTIGFGMLILSLMSYINKK
ncbi:putative holin-like toxin [Bacillus glycinifermentans]